MARPRVDDVRIQQAQLFRTHDHLFLEKLENGWLVKPRNNIDETSEPLTIPRQTTLPGMLPATFSKMASVEHPCLLSFALAASSRCTTKCISWACFEGIISFDNSDKPSNNCNLRVYAAQSQSRLMQSTLYTFRCCLHNNFSTRIYSCYYDEFAIWTYIPIFVIVLSLVSSSVRWICRSFRFEERAGPITIHICVREKERDGFEGS